MYMQVSLGTVRNADKRTVLWIGLDPGWLSRILKKASDPGSKTKKKQKCYQALGNMTRDVPDPGSRYFSIRDPGLKKSSGSRIRIHNPADKDLLSIWCV